MHYRARYLSGHLRLQTNQLPDLAEGELVMVTIERGRSEASHKHQFAWVKDAWLNLPEADQMQPWAETPETLRKHALIATGYHQLTVLDCGAKATAQRVKAALVAAEAKGHGYALGQVQGAVLRVWTPESQSVRAMGGERFQQSKTAIMDWIAGRIGCAPEDLQRGAA